MNMITLKKSLLRLLVDVDSQRLTPEQAARKIHKLFDKETCKEDQENRLLKSEIPLEVSVQLK